MSVGDMAWLSRQSKRSVCQNFIYLRLRDGLSFNIFDNLNKCSKEIESLFVKIEIKHLKNIILSLIYRPPNEGNNTLFENQPKHILSKNDVQNKQLHWQGILIFVFLTMKKITKLVSL